MIAVKMVIAYTKKVHLCIYLTNWNKYWIVL